MYKRKRKKVNTVTNWALSNPVGRTGNRISSNKDNKTLILHKHTVKNDMNMTCWATGQSAAYFEIKRLKFSDLASPVRIQFALTDCQSQNTRVYIQATNAPFRNVGSQCHQIKSPAFDTSAKQYLQCMAFWPTMGFFLC